MASNTHATVALFVIAAALVAPTCATLPVHTQEPTRDAGWRDVGLAEYRQHLQDLDELVAACQSQRAKKDGTQSSGAAQPNFDACDPARVGPNDRVQLPAGARTQPREVRYDWLRSVLGRAGNKESASHQNTIYLIPGGNKPLPPVDDQLTEARQRLQDDARQAANPSETSTDYDAERKTLNAILAQKQYEGVTEVSPRERFQEWFFNGLDKLLESLVRFGSRSPWIAWTLRILLLLAICTALIWFLVRIEQRSRVRLIPDAEPAPGAPSAREWQSWLRDAQAMAAQGLFREAIHFLYWASIARLESRRLWPADRARTPREYLALLAGTDPRKAPPDGADTEL